MKAKAATTESERIMKSKQIDSILVFLDRFEAVGFSAETRNTPEGPTPSFAFDEVLLEFQQALYDNGWVTPSFDWTEWQDKAQEFVESPAKIKSADAKTIQRLFTTHVRKERFCEGHLASMFENGHVVALLRRLKTIRLKLEKSA